ncbi:MAG: zinc ribbon domain-containing protein [Marinilabiliaceae bacterium]|nr:zinc ribbon domain-containing protein [Marinilabiliaceae bacterium]
MKSCNNCGVELDKNMTSCPLCGLEAGKKRLETGQDELNKVNLKGQILREIVNLTREQKLKLFWQISGIILGSGIVATLLINLIISHTISWAKYNLVASLALFANISAFTFLRTRPVLMVTVHFLSLAGMLFVLDQISVNANWGTKLGMPILLSLYVLLLIVLLLIRLSNQLGFNILAVIFMALGLFLLSIEGSISFYLRQVIQFGWSIIAAASLMPVAAVLFFVHYKLKKGSELKRFFHI